MLARVLYVAEVHSAIKSQENKEKVSDMSNNNPFHLYIHIIMFKQRTVRSKSSVSDNFDDLTLFGGNLSIEHCFLQNICCLASLILLNWLRLL